MSNVTCYESPLFASLFTFITFYTMVLGIVFKLIYKKYNSSIHINNSCPIFQIDFTENSDIVELPCKHVFTPHGIDKWLKEENAICPICRFKLKANEVTNSTIIDEEPAEDNLEYPAEDISLNNLLFPPLSNNLNLFNHYAYLFEQDRNSEEQQLQQSILNSILHS